MAQLLNERMNRTYTTLSERQELEPDTSLVKTYLIEAHVPESAEPAAAATLARAAFSDQTFPQAVDPRIHMADEATLLSIETTIKREHVVTYLDFTNPRYWLLHSMGSSNALDWLIERLVTAIPELDRAWIHADLLERVASWGSFRGLGLDYDRRVIPDVDFQSATAPVEVMKMQLWGNKAEDVLRILRHSDAFPHETTLAKVKVKFWLNGDVDGEFSLDDIKYDGKITARGTSFQSHIALATHVYEAYAGQIRRLEAEFAIKTQESGGRLSLDGSPINIVLGRPINNLEVFCESVFSSGPPFRLWGVPTRLSEEFYRVHAIDLHVGRPLQFEIAPEFMRVYLPEGSCGNSIVRLYTNLQHHYDSKVRAEDGDGRHIFEP